MKKNNFAQWKMKSSLGDLYLVASRNGLTQVFWHAENGVPFLKSLSENSPQAQILQQAVTELTEYFSGKRQRFDTPLDQHGTVFQKRVWKELQKIKFGQTKSYKDIAQAINSGAIRAVGSANGKNPLCIIIPCHRVINTNGGLGGYSGGLDKKQFLLELEGMRPLHFKKI
jgi:methylated-DNA-[protein]-cysteine S-methyltransferase